MPFSATNWAVAKTARDLVTSAMLEAQILAAGETASAADGNWGLEKLQRLIDQYNTREELIYNVNFSRYTLQVNHTPHTIGPGGDFNVPVRPVRLVKASLVLTSGSSIPIDIPLYIGDDAWWASNAIKDLTSTLPTAVYYSPGTPLGQLYFWPVVTQVNDVRLETWVNLTQAVDLNTSIAMPQGYWDAIVKTLAVELCPSYGKPIDPGLLMLKNEAVRAVLGNNNPPPRISLNGGGIPDAREMGTNIPDWNFLTGQRGPQG